MQDVVKQMQNLINKKVFSIKFEIVDNGVKFLYRPRSDLLLKGPQWSSDT